MERMNRAKGTKRLTASEREAMMRLAAAMQILMLDMENLKARSALVPYAARDFGLMKKKAEGLLMAFTDTIPTEQLATYRRSLEMVSFTVGIKRPGPLQRDEKNFGLWVPYEVLNALLDGCHDHCLMCNLDRAQRNACPLRKALTTIPNDVTEREDGDCPYFALI